MLRIWTALLALILLSPLPPAAAADMSPEEAQLYAAAKPEGELTWYVAQFTTSNAERVANAFAARYPGLKVNVVRATGQVIYARLTQDMKAGQPQCDMFSATDLGHMVQLKKDGQLLRYTPPNAAKVEPAYQGIDPDGFYHATAANPVVLIYHTKLVPAAEAPKNWTDLLDPKWKGKISVAHPGYSGAMGAWVVLMRKLYGWEYLEKLAKQNPHVSRSLSEPPTVLNAGERQVGISVVATTVEVAQAGNPIALVYPTDGAQMTLFASGIPASTKHPNAAKLFFDYMLGVEFSALLAKQGQPPLRPEVPPPPGALPVSQIKVAPITQDEIVAGVPEIIEKWRETFER